MGTAPDANLAPLPLTPYVPKVMVRRLERMVLKVGSPIGCSNLGELPAAANRPDGTDADYMSFRLVEPGITPGVLESLGGLLYLASGRAHGTDIPHCVRLDNRRDQHARRAFRGGAAHAC